MHRTVMIVAALSFFIVGLGQAADSSSPADNRKTGDGKGVTIDDLGRGLKSAANNVEKEIPKIGSAIENAVKKITEKGSEKTKK